MDECTQSCLSPFTACSERRHTGEQKQKQKSSCSNRCLSPIFKVLNRYKPNTYYLIIQGRYLVPGCGRRGQQLHWFDSAVAATSLYLKFPPADELFVNQLSQPQAHCFFFPRGSVMRAQKTESTEAGDAHAAPCVCPQGWAQAAQPIGGERVCGQRVGGAGWQESAPRPQIKKKISSCLTRLYFGSTLLSRLSSFPPSPPFLCRMPKPLIW